MAVYRIRVFIEDDHEIYRDIEIQGRQRFADLHKQIVQSFNFQPNQAAEYVSSDQQWYEGDTVVELDGNLDGDHQKIVSHINFPRQRFLCVTMSYKEVGPRGLPVGENRTAPHRTAPIAQTATRNS